MPDRDIDPEKAPTPREMPASQPLSVPVPPEPERAPPSPNESPAAPPLSVPVPPATPTRPEGPGESDIDPPLSVPFSMSLSQP